MIIGAPKEIKNHEYRVGITPSTVKKFTENNHSVLIEGGAGLASGFSDDDFKKAGALITNSSFIWLVSDIIIKVKEPLIEEMKKYQTLMMDWPYRKKSDDLIIFAFFHFSANPELKAIILEKKIKAVPYENIQLTDGSRPILKAMSKVAAEISVDNAAHYLRKENGGKGILLRDAKAVVIGCEGVVGKTTFDILLDRGTYVIGFDLKEKLRFVIETNSCYEKRILSVSRLVETLKIADLIICAAATKGEGAPKIITREMLKFMESGSVIIDPSIDEGGCCETSKPTSHDKPVFIEEGVIHYCVANMPGVVPRSSTPALVEETFSYILEVVNKGWDLAIKENEILTRAAILN